MKDSELLFNLGKLVGMLQAKQIFTQPDFNFAEATLKEVVTIISAGIDNANIGVDV